MTQDNTTTEAPVAKPAKSAPELRTVTMDDGRVVEFTMKAKLKKSVEFDGPSGVQVRLDWANGETRLFALPEMLLPQFAGHGALQKLGDEIAGVDAIEDCVTVVDELIERLNKGDWTIVREGGAGGAKGSSILFKALVEFFAGAKTPAEVMTSLAAKTQKEKMALRANPKIKVIVDRLEAERDARLAKKDPTAVIDSDAVLGTF